MAVRFLPKLGRERSHGLFFVVDLSPVPAVLCDAAQTGGSIAIWCICRRDKMPCPGRYAMVAKGSPRRLRCLYYIMKMQQNTVP